MRFIICSIILFLFSYACAQTSPSNCHCDHVISKNGGYAADQTYKPGQTICISAGKYTFLSFFNFSGTAQNPYLFINCGGQVTFESSTGSSGLSFTNCQHFVISGEGSDAYKYGFLVSKTAPGLHAISVGGKSSDCEIKQVEVAGAGFAGIVVKMDPTCDSTTWRGNFAMYNINLHHNYVHDVSGEGFYIGNSFWNQGMTRTCNGINKVVYPHEIYGLQIHHNLVEKTGAEGIQYGCSPDAVVHHNKVYDTGLDPFAAFQNNGVQIGGGSGGQFFNNEIYNAPGTGLIIIGYKTSISIFNNLVVNSGEYGLFCDDREGTQRDNTVQIINNTFCKTGKDGLRFYNEINRNIVINNIVADVGTPNFISFLQGAKADQKTNLFMSNADALKFVDIGSKNYMLTANSPAIDMGSDVSIEQITFDLTGSPRPLGHTFDIGACEYTGDENKFILYPSPTNQTLSIRATATIQSILIYTASGQLCQNLTIEKGDKEAFIHVDQLPAAIYVIRVQTDLGKVSGKFVKL